MDAHKDRVSSNRAPSSANPRRRRGYSDEDDNAFGSKRQRTAVACNSCKNRKSRCNGVRPTCSTCLDLGFECVYRAPSRAQNPQARELHWMRNRLQSIEELLCNIGVQAHGYQRDPGSPQDRPLSPDVPPSSSVVEAQASELSQHDSTTCVVDKLPGEDTVDGMGAITFADESTSGHFGPSSNSAFFSHITRFLDSTTTKSTQRNAPSQHLATDLSRPASPPIAPKPQVEKPPNPYILPPREDILRMVEAFFSVTGMFFPFIHKRSVIDMVEELSISKFSRVRQSWLCLLNAIMAIGISLSVEQDMSIRSREVESGVYFQRALILSPWTLSNPANLETLQALALMTIYLQGVSKSAQTWRIHGLLVQAAFQMGVHTNIRSPKIPPLEQEIRTRIWYMCFVLDRVLSMVYGRPPLIHNSYMQIDLPLNVDLDIHDHEERDAPSVRTPNEPSSCSLFLATIKLYLIQGNMIESLYNQNIIPSVDLQPNRLFGSIMEFEEHLIEWRRTLDTTVDLIPTSEINTAHTHEWKWTRPQTVMTIRFLSVRVLLYRRVIETLLDTISAPGTGTQQLEYSLPIAQTLIQACTDSAIAIIQTIRALGARNEMLPAWWFTVYHMFNATLVLFGVVCLQTIGKVSLHPCTPSELVLFMQMALEDLVVVGRDTRIVRRCSKYLQKIIQISRSLARNSSSKQSPHLDPPVPPPIPHCDSVHFVSDESMQSPWDADFGQFLINDDSNFLDGWTDLVEPLPHL